MAEPGRLNAIERPVRLVRALVEGKRLSRADAAGLLESQPAAADRQLKVLVHHLPVTATKRKGRVFYEWSQPGSARPKLLSLPAVIAGCFGSSLHRLFAGTTYEPGMRQAAQFLISHSVDPKRFSDADRQFIFLVRGGEIALPEQQGSL